MQIIPQLQLFLAGEEVIDLTLNLRDPRRAYYPSGVSASNPAYAAARDGDK